MIGHLATDAGVMLELSDAGVWQVPADTEEELRPLLQVQADGLNVICNPKEPEFGDHHFPFGVAALMRAAEFLGTRYELETPVQPLPDGAVS